MEQKYIAQMEAIKRRIASIVKIVELSAGGHLYLPVTVESIYLQFRYILEHIAMAALVANREALEESGKSLRKLGKQWKAGAILKNIANSNPDYYPVPIVEEQSNYQGVRANLVEKTTEFLTLDKYTKLYNLCGEVLHTDNPLGKQTDHDKLLQDGSVWQELIMNLLGCHKIILVGRDGFWLVHMHESTDGKVHMYEFERIKRASTERVLVGTVNVPYRQQLGAKEIAQAIRNEDFTHGQVASFFGEIDADDQLEFAALHGISEDLLVNLARKFKQMTGQYAVLAE